MNDEDEVVCQECGYTGDIKQVCGHVVKGHDIEWQEYKEKYDVDTEELSRQNRRNSRRGWKLRKKYLTQ